MADDTEITVFRARPPFLLCTRRIWQREAEKVFELRERENDHVCIPIRQVIVQRYKLASDLSRLSWRFERETLRGGGRHGPREQRPSPDPLPHEIPVSSRTPDNGIIADRAAADVLF
jgi:hypothetical protein